MNNNQTIAERELRLRQFWKDSNIFGKSIKNRQESTPFVFYEGPPTANGLPHVGHALGRTIKDVVARYKTMQGFLVERKAGWDTHGLPVELGVEKELGISGKQEIESYGIEPFIKKCKDSVFTYEKIWRSFTEELGYWVDLDDPYLTLSNEYIESVWNILSKVHQDKLLYKGHRVSPYCPSCQTSLSSHEVAQGYKDVKDLSATVKFKLVDRDEFFLGWTTTPWTLPANVALAMHADLTYVRAELDGEIYIVAKSLVSNVVGSGAKIISEHKGIEFEGVGYYPPFNYVNVEKGHIVLMADFVKETSGTGIVHIAPAYGEDDFRIVKQYDLSFVNVVNQQGKYTDVVSDFAGKFVKDCDVEIIKLLANSNLLFHKQKYDHSYPYCWRCDTPLLYYATDSWFIKMSTLKNKLLLNNATVTWYPEHIKNGRFGNFLENVVDWNISRNRYWGTPLNVWICTSCGNEEVPESIEKLKSLATVPLPDNLELHKPYIDEITCSCPKCNHEMKRTLEVIDVWFDSGSMPFAQHHYPFKQEAFKKQFPADVVIEGIDQTRGFFYSLLAVSTLYTGQAPYKNVLSLGHVLDEHGQKMSKSKGNALDPLELMNKYGADALRWALVVDSSPWNPKRFSVKIVQEAKSKLLDTFENTFNFYYLYASIDGFKFNSTLPGNPTKMDKWILSRLHSTLYKVTTFMDDYQFTQASREIAKLIDDVSNWYVRRSRQRFWASGFSEDKRAAFNTLYEILCVLCKLLAPFTPYIAEHIYLQLQSESVHLQDYPKVNQSLINNQLEQEMNHVVKIVELGRSIRNSENLKIKQPLAEMIINSSKHYEAYQDIIQDELNVKKIHWIEDLAGLEDISLKLNFKTAGTTFGKHVNDLKKYIDNISSIEKETLLKEGKIEVLTSGNYFELDMTHVITESQVQDGYTLAEEGPLKVLLCTKLTRELIEEGQIRDFIRCIQDNRKKMNYPIEKHINLHVLCSLECQELIVRFENLIKMNVLVQDIAFVSSIDSQSVIKYELGKNELKFTMNLN
ncbi:isoleucine--tRNA ligase [Ureibacillus sp. MALMAid1270]|uniref:isoleucine--tRNA ligase n=1 Tax=Ureibacillus sp. MALMAid1270 TaxID=3411629 RepID=UPI003BA53B5A